MIDGLSNSIITYLEKHPRSSSRDIFEALSDDAGYATIKRRLATLAAQGFLAVEGQRRSTRYAVHEAFSVIHPVDPEAYFEKDVHQRVVRTAFNHELIPLLGRLSLFTAAEEEHLAMLRVRYQDRISGLSGTEYRQEMERLAIDLSWKSSQIEGNTYSLLETERLLKDQITAGGKTRDEATMLLNHKAAIDFILAEPGYADPLGIRAIEDIHSLLMKDLGVGRNLRHRSVGVSGTNYRPLDNEFQIREAMEDLCRLVNRSAEPYAKALLLLLLISYIQPFTDGNKRTARILSNAVLLVKGCCPLSFRTVDPFDYKKAMLIFYEQNNISAFKKLFIEQAEFAANTYF
jgi:fido (protein-threonine AMPylation protein)